MQQQIATPKLIGILLAAVVGMFGFGYALVPLYDVFCEITGINGKTAKEAIVYEAGYVDEKRLVTIEFIANVSPGMPWDFAPEVKKIQVHPGELKQVSFIAQNQISEMTLGQAVPSVSPGLAALYFNKTECFCFQSQQLTAGASVNMPLIFFIDPALPEEIKTLTLAYTLYNISDQLPNSTDDPGV
ncbi:cytochrome c oxidase assembly protein [Paraferrimonas sp. SM1919]|uniref:cytochrome c oxidase assembly protein n=1 Tax=Paraferrimonas sp. SM1919 TaxID=2662263 RepID=UPI0013D6E733|nr:cytochrome c oxidase assembly protein [Paraferrimonas sp. SM1919]